MIARIDWLNNGIDRMLAGKRPLTPGHWGVYASIMTRDVDLLMLAAGFSSLRPAASQPEPAFVAGLRVRMVAELAELAELAEASDGVKNCGGNNK